jgi:hypothetical protein
MALGKMTENLLNSSQELSFEASIFSSVGACIFKTMV